MSVADTTPRYAVDDELRMRPSVPAAYKLARIRRWLPDSVLIQFADGASAQIKKSELFYGAASTEEKWGKPCCGADYLDLRDVIPVAAIDSEGSVTFYSRHSAINAQLSKLLVGSIVVANYWRATKDTIFARIDGGVLVSIPTSAYKQTIGVNDWTQYIESPFSKGDRLAIRIVSIDNVRGYCEAVPYSDFDRTTGRLFYHGGGPDSNRENRRLFLSDRVSECEEIPVGDSLSIETRVYGELRRLGIGNNGADKARSLLALTFQDVVPSVFPVTILGSDPRQPAGLLVSVNHGLNLQPEVSKVLERHIGILGVPGKTLTDTGSFQWEFLWESGDEYNDLKSIVNDLAVRVSEKLPNGTQLCVFRMHITSERVGLIYGSALVSQRFCKLARHLHKSPIKDVILNEEDLHVAGVDVYNKTYIWLQDLVSFRSVMGFRCRYVDEGGNGYGVFAFSVDPAGFSLQDEFACRTFSLDLSSAVREMDLIKEARKLESEAAKGRALEDIGHETHAAIGGLYNDVGYFVEGRGSPQEMELFRADIEECLGFAGELLPPLDGMKRQYQTSSVITNIASFVARAMNRWRDIRLRHGENVPDVYLYRTGSVDYIPAINNVGLKVILLNLLRNATKCADSIKRHLVIECDIFISDLDDKLRLVLLLHDNAGGIHGTNLRCIFERGFSLTGGTGLGLAFCKQRLHSIGGEFLVDQTTVGGGTTFRIELPIGVEVGKI